MAEKDIVKESTVVYTPSDGSAYPVIRALAPGEPGYDLVPEGLAGCHDTAEDFLAFLSSRPAADDPPRADMRPG